MHSEGVDDVRAQSNDAGSEREEREARGQALRRMWGRRWRRGPHTASSRLTPALASEREAIVVNKSGAGFIGTTLARRLVDGERDRRDRQPPPRHARWQPALTASSNFRFVQGDISRPRPASPMRSQYRAYSPLHRGSPAWTRFLAGPVRTIHVEHHQNVRRPGATLGSRDSIERLVDFSTSEVFGQHAFDVHQSHATTLGSWARRAGPRRHQAGRRAPGACYH